MVTNVQQTTISLYEDQDVKTFWKAIAELGWSNSKVATVLERLITAPNEDILIRARIDTVTLKRSQRGPDKIVIEYSLPTPTIDEVGATIMDEELRRDFKVSDTEEARPQFYDAVEAFIPIIGVLTNLSCDYFEVANTHITKIHFPVREHGEGGWMDGLMLNCCKVLEEGGPPWNFPTPTWWREPLTEGGDDSRCYPLPIATKVEQLQKEARLYIRGVRAQSSLI